MKLKEAGKSISEIEIVNISKHGFWILLYGQEYFLSFKQFPWFKEAKISSIMNVTLPHPNHLFWPELDIDLELESLINPRKYPLLYK